MTDKDHRGNDLEQHCVTLALENEHNSFEFKKTYSPGLIDKMKKTTCKLPIGFRW